MSTSATPPPDADPTDAALPNPTVPAADRAGGADQNPDSATNPTGRATTDIATTTNPTTPTKSATNPTAPTNPNPRSTTNPTGPTATDSTAVTGPAGTATNSAGPAIASSGAEAANPAGDSSGTGGSPEAKTISGQAANMAAANESATISTRRAIDTTTAANSPRLTTNSAADSAGTTTGTTAGAALLVTDPAAAGAPASIPPAAAYLADPFEPREPETLDFLGRRYHVGPAAERLLGGRRREWMLWLPWAAMAAIGILQYGFGSLVPSLVGRGWAPGDVFWLLALWTVFQAGAGFPVAFLRERGRIGPRTAMIAGAVLLTLGPLSLAHGDELVAVLGYSVLSGTGAGLVYATCSSTVAKWYPERTAAKVSVATGAFAYGSVPFAVAFLFTGGSAPMLDGTAALVGLVVLGAGIVLRDPPAHWWPPDVDPREWALDRRRSPVNAVRQYSPREAMRTGAAPLMYLILFCASAVSLFDITFLATLGGRLRAALAVIAAGTALLLGTNGAGRALAIHVSERVGRTRTLGWVLAVLAVGQLCLASAATTGSVAMLLLATLLAGTGGGAFYPLFASLVREYFGDQSPGARQTHAAVYSAKAFGGLLGVGVAALAVPAWGFPTVVMLACVLAIGSAALCVKLRQPGRFLPGVPPQRVA